MEYAEILVWIFISAINIIILKAASNRYKKASTILDDASKYYNEADEILKLADGKLEEAQEIYKEIKCFRDYCKDSDNYRVK